MYERFTPDQITDEANQWLLTYSGTYARLLKRTKAEGKRAFVVFCDLGLFQDYRDVKAYFRCRTFGSKSKKFNPEQSFIDAFMSSSTVSNITQKELVSGSVEYNELVNSYLGDD